MNNADKHNLVRLAFSTVAQGDVGFVGEFPEGSNWKEVTYAGEIKDGTEIFAMVCDRPAPDMQYDGTIFDVTIAIFHGKRSPSDSDWMGHSEVCGLLTKIATDVRQVIYSVAGVVK